MLFDLWWTASFAIASHQSLQHSDPSAEGSLGQSIRHAEGEGESAVTDAFLEGSLDQSDRAEQRAGRGEGESGITQSSATGQKRDAAEALEDGETTMDVAKEAEKAAVAIAASYAVPPALRVVADEPAVIAACATAPIFPRWENPEDAAEGAGPGTEDSGDVSGDAGGDY